MSRTNKIAGAIGASCLALAAFSGTAIAEDKLELSASVAGTNDYVFRGFTQTLEDPAIQGSVDASYGIFYLGVWASGVDFVEGGSNAENSGDANVEVDVYAGIKPKLGPVDFDLGVIGYLYPGGKDDGAELDYLELKLGASGEFIKSLSTGITYYYSPEYTLSSGETHFIELNAGYEFNKIGMFTPSISGLVGFGIFADDSSLDYTYWNAGLTLGVENFALDFRYWDTDVDSGLSDERFVFTASVSVP